MNGQACVTWHSTKPRVNYSVSDSMRGKPCSSQPDSLPILGCLHSPAVIGSSVTAAVTRFRLYLMLGPTFDVIR